MWGWMFDFYNSNFIRIHCVPNFLRLCIDMTTFINLNRDIDGVGNVTAKAIFCVCSI